MIVCNLNYCIYLSFLDSLAVYFGAFKLLDQHNILNIPSLFFVLEIKIYKPLKVKVKFAQSRPTLCDPWTIQSVEFSRPENWEWVVFLFSRGSSPPRDRTLISHIAGGFFTSGATREAQEYWSG